MDLAKRPITFDNMHTHIIQRRVDMGGSFKKLKLLFSQDFERAKYDPDLINLWLEAKFLESLINKTINEYMCFLWESIFWENRELHEGVMHLVHIWTQLPINLSKQLHGKSILGQNCLYNQIESNIMSSLLILVHPNGLQ